MRLTEIRVGIRYTKNLGNYESFTAEAGATVAVEPQDDENAVFAPAWEVVKAEVRRQIESLPKKG